MKTKGDGNVASATVTAVGGGTVQTNQVPCITFILLHYFHLTNFFWMFVEGSKSYVFRRENNFIVWDIDIKDAQKYSFRKKWNCIQGSTCMYWLWKLLSRKISNYGYMLASVGVSLEIPHSPNNSVSFCIHMRWFSVSMNRIVHNIYFFRIGVPLVVVVVWSIAKWLTQSDATEHQVIRLNIYVFLE